MPYQPKKYSSDFYRDQMLNLIQSRSAGVLKEKRKMERMQEEAEKEQAGKWGDVAMLGASLGGMLGSVIPGAGTGIGMGIGAGAGALLGLGRGLAGGAGGKDFLKGAVPSPMAAAAGMSSMSHQLAAERARSGRDYLPRQSGFDRGMAATQAFMPLAGMAARGMAPPVAAHLPPPDLMGPPAGLEAGPSLAPQGPSPLEQFTMLQPGMLGQPASGLPGLASGIRPPRYSY